MQQNEEKHGHVQLMLPERTAPFEITAECILPDYRSEISRLLWVRPTLMPPERFIGGGRAEFSGKILFEILYTGPDGALYGAEHEQGYSFTVPLEGAYALEGIELFAEPVADAVISRVTGPRRLTVRCRTHALVHGFAEKALVTHQHGVPEGAQPHLLCDVTDVSFAICGGREELTLSESIPCEEGTRVICARGALFLPEVRAATDEVRVGGEAVITVLTVQEEGALPRVLEKRIPFECCVPLEGTRPDHSVCAMGTVGQIEACVQDGQIILSPHLILTAQSQRSEPVALCRDAFLPGQSAQCRFEELTARQSGTCCSRHFSICAEHNTKELGIAEECEIVDHACEAEICEKSTEDGKTVWSGKLQCHLLCTRGGELYTQDAALPFRLSPGIGGEDAHTDCHVSACRIRLQNGVLRADAELQLCIREAKPLPIHPLCDVTFSPCEPVTRGAIELYYPAPEQTLWDVAKQYGISPDALCEANGLTCDAPGAADSLSGKRFLLIP